MSVYLRDPVSQFINTTFGPTPAMGYLINDTFALYYPLTNIKIGWLGCIEDLQHVDVEKWEFEPIHQQAVQLTIRQLWLSLLAVHERVASPFTNCAHASITQTQTQQTESVMTEMMTTFSQLYCDNKEFREYHLNRDFNRNFNQLKRHPLATMRKRLKQLPQECVMNINAWVDIYKDLSMMYLKQWKPLKIKNKISKTIILVGHSYKDNITLNNHLIPLYNANLRVFRREELLDMLLYLNNVTPFDDNYKVLQSNIVYELASR